MRPQKREEDKGWLIRALSYGWLLLAMVLIRALSGVSCVR